MTTEMSVSEVDTSRAVIEFEMDGTVLKANETLLSLLGYELDQIAGQHHRIFLDEDDASSPEYEAFWQNLRDGIEQQGEFRRLTSSGKAVWLRASYKPIKDMSGKVTKVLKSAVDITTQKLQDAYLIGQIEAIHATQAVVEFELDGTIIKANDLFLDAVGYSLDEIAGEHHKMFVDDEYASSPEYEAFWEDLRAGKIRQGEFKRVGNDGVELWLQASFVPIKDASGKPFRVVKYAKDVTDQRSRIDGIPTPVMAIDREFNITFINVAGADIVGCAPEEAIGQKCYELFSTPHCNTKECRCHQAMERDRVRSGETVVGAAGDLPISYAGAPVKDGRGRIVGAVEYAVDMFIQKEIQAGVEAGAAELSKVVKSVAENSTKMEEQMVSVAEQTGAVVSAAEELSSTMASLASGAEQSERNVSSVATATEEMTATVAEVARNSQNALGVAEEAVKSVERAADKVQDLGSAATQISQVTETIVEIADQTKLLALNATIEAARAGEAGKGFAVVASEVKELAQQTNNATSDIRNKIEAIQVATSATIEQIQMITKVIQEVNEFVSSIATATEEQSITTQDISNNITEVKAAVADMANNINEAATVTSNVAANISNANASIEEVEAAAIAMKNSGSQLAKTEQALLAAVAKF